MLGDPAVSETSFSTASVLGVRGLADDTVAPMTEGSVRMSSPADLKSELWTSGMPPVPEEGKLDNGDEFKGVWKAGVASVFPVSTAAGVAAAFAASAALLSISSILRCTIRGISCT